jgi:hypothetical protein
MKKKKILTFYATPMSNYMLTGNTARVGKQRKAWGAALISNLIWQRCLKA